MTRFFLLIVPIVAQIVVLYAASIYLNRGLYARLGRTVYLLFMWPGVIVHETSHLIACLVTRTRVRKVRFFEPRQDAPNSLVLGYVEHDKPRSPLVAAFVGAAPFFGGSAVLYLCFRLFVGSHFQAAGLAVDIPTGSTASVAVALTAAAKSYAAFLRALASSLHWNQWTTYVFLYFTVAVSSHVAPSWPDLKHTFLGLAGLVFAVGMTALFIRLLGVTLTDADWNWLSHPALTVSALLGCGIAGAGLFAVAFFVMETVAALMRRFRRG